MNMKKTLLTTTLAVTSTLMGCGPGAKIDGKDGAAQAVHALTAPTQPAAGGSDAGAGDLSDASSACPRGGTAKLSNFSSKVDISGSGASAALNFTMTLTECGLATCDRGDVVYNGVVTVDRKLIANASGVQMEHTFKGDLTLGGGISDTLLVDVTDSVNVVDMGKTGSVSVVLKGTATTSTSTYTYDGSIDVTAGKIAISSVASK